MMCITAVGKGRIQGIKLNNKNYIILSLKLKNLIWVNNPLRVG
jgi:hypothetical protein